jgi:hypothetical protein
MEELQRVVMSCVYAREPFNNRGMLFYWYNILDPFNTQQYVHTIA